MNGEKIILIEDDVLVDYLSLFQGILDIQVPKAKRENWRNSGVGPYSQFMQYVASQSAKDTCLHILEEIQVTCKLQVDVLHFLEIIRSNCEPKSRIVVFSKENEIRNLVKKVSYSLANQNVEIIDWYLEHASFFTYEDITDEPIINDKENRHQDIIAFASTQLGKEFALRNGSRLCLLLDENIQQPHVSNFSFSSVAFKNQVSPTSLQKVSPMHDICSLEERNTWSQFFKFPQAITLAGIIVRGFQRGSSQLGIPTANIVVPTILQYTGVFFGSGQVEGYEQTFNFAASYGNNPFFGNEKMTLEPHFFHDFEGQELYGLNATLSVKGMIRPQSPFANFNCLIRAIQSDCEIARRLCVLEF